MTMNERTFMHNTRGVLESLQVLPAEDAAAILSTCLISHLRVVNDEGLIRHSYEYLKEVFMMLSEMLATQEMHEGASVH